MRVLFLWNTAGVMTPVIEWMNENGHEARVIMRNFEGYKGLVPEIEAAIMVETPRQFYSTIIRQIRGFNPDAIHVDSSMISLVISRMVALRKPIVLLYHGTEVRGRKNIHSEAKLADMITVSTQDLKQYGIWIDRPVMTKFRYQGGREKRTAIMFYSSHYMKDNRELAKSWCEQRGIILTIFDWGMNSIIPHDEMPKFLSKFEYFIDFKGCETDGTYSLLALESLKCGCKVVSDTDIEKVITIEDYTVKSGADYLEIYQSLQKPSILLTIKRFPRLIIGIIRFLAGRLPG
jgi:hypothetical protein